jgi:acetylornithine deacetylase
MAQHPGDAELTDVERTALAALDEQALVDSLLDLIAVPSITGSAAESDLQHRLAERLRRLDLDVDLWPFDLDALRADPAFPGTEAPRTEAWGLAAHRPGTEDGPGERPALILQGHVDVVPPGDRARWAGDPFQPRIVGDDVHGRGACDMKAGVAANVAAVTAIRAAGIRLRRGLAVHSVVGEEDGGLGAFGTLARGHTGAACVITEPTGGTLIIANGGALTFRITVPGAATHGSTRYAGVSAIDAYLPLHRALGALEARRNADPDPLMAEYPIAYPLSVGTLAAGDWASTVPDRLVADGRLGIALGEDPAAARAELEQAIADACAEDPWLREHPATVDWPGGQFASGRLDGADPLRDTVSRAWVNAGGALPRERGAPYGSDLRLYAGHGIPTLHLGPGDVRLAHSSQESVPISETILAARALILAVLRTCGVA